MNPKTYHIFPIHHSRPGTDGKLLVAAGSHEDSSNCGYVNEESLPSSHVSVELFRHSSPLAPAESSELLSGCPCEASCWEYRNVPFLCASFLLNLFETKSFY